TVTPAGGFPSGWPAPGIDWAQVSKTQSPAQNGFAVDDSGCVWHSAFGMAVSKPSAQLVRPDGVVLPGSGAWSATTLTATATSMDVAQARGGAYVTWGPRIQRLTRSGAAAPGWPAAGVALGFGGDETAVMPDGAGGAVVLGIQFGGTPTVQRI